MKGNMAHRGDFLGGMILWADSDAEWILNRGEKLAALTSEAKRGPGQRVRHWGSRHSPWCSGRDHRASIFNIELCATRITQALSSSSWHKVFYLLFRMATAMAFYWSGPACRSQSRPQTPVSASPGDSPYYLTHLLDPILELCCFQGRMQKAMGQPFSFELTTLSLILITLLLSKERIKIPWLKKNLFSKLNIYFKWCPIYQIEPSTKTAILPYY